MTWDTSDLQLNYRCRLPTLEALKQIELALLHSEVRNRQRSRSDAYLRPVKCSETHRTLFEPRLKRSAAHLRPI